jgi:hypothetical protein
VEYGVGEPLADAEARTVRLAFAETRSQAVAVPQNCEIVALAPRAEIELVRIGRAFRLPVDYASWEQIEQVGLSSFAAIDRIADAIDELAADHIPAIVEHGIRPARWHSMTLKQLVDGIWVNALRIGAILERERPATVFRFAADTRAARVLELLAPAATVFEDPDPEPPAPPTKVGRLPSPATRLTALLRRTAQRRRRRVLLLDVVYSTPSIARELQRLGFSTPLLPTPPVSVRRADALWHAVQTDPRIRSEFVRAGIDFWAAASDQLREIVTLGVPEAVATFERARAEVLRIRPHAALTAVAAFPAQKARCAAVSSTGVPVAVSRHGEYGARHIPIGNYHDPESVDWVLCWGAWEAANLGRHAHTPVDTVVVGAPMIETAVESAPGRQDVRAQLGFSRTERILLYASANLSGDDWYASRHRPDDSTHFTRRLATLRTLASIPGATVVVKAHPSERPDPLEPAAAAAGAHLIYEPTFAELIHLADVLVLDAPAATMAQALFGTATIVIVDHPVYAWEPGVREHLAAYGVIFTDPTGLGDTVAQAPSGDGFSQDAREPLVKGGRESAAARAARALAAIAAGERPS